MAETILNADFGASYYATTDPIRQYDDGVKLAISSEIELPEFYQVHFANDRYAEDSIAQLATDNVVTIPFDVTKTGETIFAWIYLEDSESAVSKLEAQIPVRHRANLPSGEEPEERERTIIEDAIEALNTAVGQTSQDVIDANSAADIAKASADKAEEIYNDVKDISFHIDSDGCIIYTGPEGGE